MKTLHFEVMTMEEEKQMAKRTNKIFFSTQVSMYFQAKMPFGLRLSLAIQEEPLE